MKPTQPIFIVSRFRSGSSFVWNVFRQDSQYRCFYEPFHDNLTESVATNVAVMESHRGIESYWDEYKPLRNDLASVHRPQFGISNLLLRPHDRQPELADFIRQLIKLSEREGKTCVIKCNRLDFRLAWIRQNFPDARLVHVVRNSRDQWISSVRPHKNELWDRLEENRGYDLPAWISSLAPAWPFLLAGPSRPAYYYSYLLWKLSALFGERYAQTQVDFDEDIVAEPEQFQRKVAAFFPSGFFAQPAVRAIFKPTLPGQWRRFRTEEWFRELEAAAEKTLNRAGVYKPAFWNWTAAKPRTAPPDEALKAIDLALLTYSRHRGELLVHGHELQTSLNEAKQYAESLRTEFDKSSQALKTVGAEQEATQYKLRLLQAVYDSLKQAHELSITSLNKTLEEFQFTTKELRQLITYKDAQLQQLIGDAASAPKSLPASGPADGLLGQIAAARQTEQGLRHELEAVRLQLSKVETAAKTELADARVTADSLRNELNGAKGEAQEAKQLKKHAMALEMSSAEAWANLQGVKKQLASAEVRRTQLEQSLQKKNLEIERLTASQNAAAQAQAQVLAGKEQEISVLHAQLAQSKADAQSLEAGQRAAAQLHAQTLAGKDQEISAQRTKLMEATSGLTTLGIELRETQAELSSANTRLNSYEATKVHLTSLEQACQESWRLIVGLRRELAGLANTCRLQESERQTRIAACEGLEKQLTQASARTHELEAQVAQMGRELDQQSITLRASVTRSEYLEIEVSKGRQHIQSLENNAAKTSELLQKVQADLLLSEGKYEKSQAIVQDLSGELTQAHQRIGALEVSAALAAEHLRGLQTDLQQSEEKHAGAQASVSQLNSELKQARQRIAELDAAAMAAGNRLAGLQADLASHQLSNETLTKQVSNLEESLAAEQSARATEAAAFDQRTAVHLGNLAQAHESAKAAQARWETREAELNQLMAHLEKRLAAANARLAAIEQSWASGLIQRIAPAAFKINNPQ